MEIHKPGPWFQTLAVFACWLCLSLPAAAIEKIKLHALFQGKAIFLIDGERRVLAAGEVSPEGVKLLRTDTTNETAVVEIDGRAQTINLGIVSTAPGSSDGGKSIVLWAEPNGFFRAYGSINGIAVKFLVDTGASAVAMNRMTADRLGLDYKSGKRGVASTAGGYVGAYSVRLDRVKVGSITLHNVDASVIDGTHPEEVLLGMSFLGRLDMRREGAKMELNRRY